MAFLLLRFGILCPATEPLYRAVQRQEPSRCLAGSNVPPHEPFHADYPACATQPHPVSTPLLDFAEHNVHICGGHCLAIHDATVFAELGEVLVVHFGAAAGRVSEDSKALECLLCF